MKRTLTKALSPLVATALLTAACANPWADDGAGPEPAAQPGGRAAADDPGSGQEPSDSGLVQQAAEQKSVQDQKTAVLVREYVENGRMAYADGRLLEAKNHALDAVALDPSDREARRLLEDVQVALGEANTDIVGSSEDVRARTQARVSAMQARVRSQYERAQQLYADGEYDKAIGELRTAKANIQNSPFSVDWDGMGESIDSLLEQAEQEREAALRAQRDDQIQETYERLQEQRRLREEMRQRRINGMLSEAVDAFEEEDYDRTEELAEAVLQLEPLHARATELRDTARRARFETRESTFRRERLERFRKWEQDNEAAKIPQNDVLVDPDPAHWERISKLRAHYRDLEIGVETDPLTLQLMEDISTQRVPGLVFEGETSLNVVVDSLRRFTSIPFVVTPDAVDAVDIEGIEFNLNLTHDLTVENALNIITDAAGEEVTYTFRHGTVYITTTARANRDLVLMPHDVKDLVAWLVDHSGPKIDEIRLPDQDYFGLDEDEGGAFGGVVGEPLPVYDPDNLETLIRQSIAPQTWDEIDGVSISFSNGILFVRHTRDVQEELREFLDSLRDYISSMVTIEARFLTITKDYLQEIGIDWRGNGGTSTPQDLADLDDVTSGLEDNASLGLDNNGLGLPAGAASNPSSGFFFDEFTDGDLRGRTENILGAYGERLGVAGGLTMQLSFLDDLQYNLILNAVEKSQHAEELTATTLSAQNTQRAYATMLNQITYVQDFDVEVALASFIADPIVGVVSDGVVLDVRPTISQDRRYITLELRPTVATLVRPLPEFTSSLAGLTTPVTLQLPELQVASANTTAVVPDGGVVMIGGLKKLFDLDQRSEVPFLADIPVLSLLFKKEGEVSENRDVILLIRATITDANEVQGRLDDLEAR